jgi:hypothetical protein
MSVCTARAPRRLESISNGRFQRRKADNRDGQSRVYSFEKLEILRPPFFSRKSSAPKMARTFLV